MIDRYSITATKQIIAERFAVDVPDFYKAKYNAAPTHLLPVITSTSPNGISLFYWGTSPEWSKNKTVSERMINVRTENLSDKPALKKALRKHRCIVPADGFYGWKKVGKKTSIPYRFIFKSQNLFSFPALWEEFEDTEGNQIQTFAIITTQSDKLVNTIQERMPVILTRESEKVWLDKETSDDVLMKIISSSETREMNYYPVSPR